MSRSASVISTMALGDERDLSTVAIGDTAELYAFLYDAADSAVDPDLITSVEFTIQKPDGTQATDDGVINLDGSGFLRWGDTANKGRYVATARFTLDSGEIRSVPIDFQVIDPFDTVPVDQQQIIDAVWLRLEDCFDSEEGGPWLRDQTLAYFTKDKISAFINDALMEINVYPPMTHAVISDFTSVTADTPVDPDQPVLVQATLLATIRHLMRSYVEQPEPRGANVVWQDRRDYMLRWQTIYQIELERFTRWLALWKRQFLNLGKSALLVHSKAGRLYGPGLRTRSAIRGYW